MKDIIWLTKFTNLLLEHLYVGISKTSVNDCYVGFFNAFITSFVQSVHFVTADIFYKGIIFIFKFFEVG